MKKASSYYNRFLLSTCLPVFAFTLCNAPVANAGFEWTPPPKVEPAPLPPIETKDAVVPEPVTSEPLTEDVMPDAPAVLTEEPAIEIKVLENDQEVETPEIETPVEEIPAPIAETPSPEVEVEVVIEEIEDLEDDAVVEIKMEEAEPVQEISVIETIEEEDKNEATTIEEIVVQEDMQEEVNAVDVQTDVEVTEPVEDDNSLTINPYPLEKAEEEAEQEQSNVVVEAPKEVIHWNTPESFDVIEGFGADMPLALALRQIVPPSYAFSFGEGVNPGTKISWDGGKPWNTVLTDALSPLSIDFKIHGKRLLLNRVAVKAAPAPVSEDASAMQESAEPVEIIEPQEEASLEDVIDDVIKAETVEQASETEEKAMDDSVPAEKAEDTAVIDITDAANNAPEIAHQQEESINAPAPEIIAEDASESMEKLEESVTTSSEEGIQPVEIIEGQVNEIPSPDAEALSEAIEAPVEETVVPRKAVLDPGQVESQQPEAQSTPEAPAFLDEKKNELEKEAKSASENAVIEVASVDPIASLDAGTQESGEDSSPAEELEQIVPSSAPEAHLSSYRNTPSNEVKVWDVKSGARLQDVLEQWAQDENIQVLWNASQDYEVNTTLFINGTFENAIEVLLSKGVETAPDYKITTDGAYTLRVTD